MKFTIKQAVLVIALAGAFSTANATSLPEETASANVDIVGSFFGGTLLDSAITNISNSSYNGIARSAVYDTGSGLDFYYQFSNNLTSVNGIDRFTAFDFGAITKPVEVFQTASAFGIFQTGTENSDYADRSNLGVIGFSFVPTGHTKIIPGTTSYIQIIRTDARLYKPGNFGLIDGIGDNAVAFAPAVPEPETYAMLLAGLGLMGTIARRRKSK